MLSITDTWLKAAGNTKRSKPTHFVRVGTAVCSDDYRTLKRALSLARRTPLNLAGTLRPPVSPLGPVALWAQLGWERDAVPESLAFAFPFSRLSLPAGLPSSILPQCPVKEVLRPCWVGVCVRA